MCYQLKADPDKVTWKFNKNGIFSVKSTYNTLTGQASGVYHKKIWKNKIPEKFKIFLWLIANGAILTKNNMLTRKWIG